MNREWLVMRWCSMLEKQPVLHSCMRCYSQPMLLQASAFFQDCYMVKLLFTMLGSRLLKAYPETASTSTADQQPAAMHHIAQVCTWRSSYQNMYCAVKYCTAWYVRCLAHASWQWPPDVCSSSVCLLYTSPSPRDRQKSRMPSSA